MTGTSPTAPCRRWASAYGYSADQAYRLARLTFWSVNRDRPCTGGGADTCGGVSQAAWDFSRVLAQYHG